MSRAENVYVNRATEDLTIVLKYVEDVPVSFSTVFPVLNCGP